MSDEEKSVVVQDQTTEIQEDNLSPVLAIPGYEGMTEARVLTGVRDLFSGFDTRTNFNGLEDLAKYTESSFNDIRQQTKKVMANSICARAAILARFWYLGDAINQELNTSKYGTGAVSKLAGLLKISVPYVYQIRAVAAKLTAVDCYLLGMRGLDTSHLRKLSQVPDNDMRKAMITQFIEAVSDTSDVESLTQAKRQLLTAINSSRDMDATEVESSNPGEDTPEEYEQVSPEYAAMHKTLDYWMKVLKPFGDQAKVSKFTGEMADFYIKEEDDPREIYLNKLSDKALELGDLVAKAQAALGDINAELQSLANMQLTTSYDDEQQN